MFKENSDSLYIAVYSPFHVHSELSAVVNANLYRQKFLISSGLVSITRQMARPRHMNKAIIRLSSHPSR